MRNIPAGLGGFLRLAKPRSLTEGAVVQAERHAQEDHAVPEPSARDCKARVTPCSVRWVRQQQHAKFELVHEVVRSTPTDRPLIDTHRENRFAHKAWNVRADLAELSSVLETAPTLPLKLTLTPSHHTRRCYRRSLRFGVLVVTNCSKPAPVMRRNWPSTARSCFSADDRSNLTALLLMSLPAFMNDRRRLLSHSLCAFTASSSSPSSLRRLPISGSSSGQGNAQC